MKWIIYFSLAVPAWAAEPGPRNATASAAPRLAPPVVQRGDKVGVKVSIGNVLLAFEAEAESSGHIGETVIVRNPDNGRRFIARVQEKGKVVVKK